MLKSENLRKAALEIYPGGKIVVPSLMYFNLLMPGQQLITHTDVPGEPKFLLQCQQNQKYEKQRYDEKHGKPVFDSRFVFYVFVS